MELLAPTHRLLTVGTYYAPFLTPPSLWPWWFLFQGGSCSTENLLFFVSFFEETFDLQPGKGGGDDMVGMISVREIPTLSALTMCFWQRFLKKHSVSKWRMSIYRHDIPERNAQGGLSVSWTSSTSSEVKNMEISVDQIIKDGCKFLDR